jgi:hypothetical protein
MIYEKTNAVEEHMPMGYGMMATGIQKKPVIIANTVTAMAALTVNCMKHSLSMLSTTMVVY